MTDRISSLRLFTRVARLGSFTAAGKEAGLSQPSVSRIISMLERDLGAALFVRSTHALRLTESGADYLARVDPILSALEEANHAVRGTGELRGQLRVGTALSFAMREVVPRLPAFLEPHPSLRIELVTTDTRQNLVGDAIDVVLRFGALRDSTMVAKKLADSPRLIAASPAYLKRRGTPKTPADLAQHDIILGPSSATSAGWTFVKDGKTTSIRVEGCMTFSVNEGTTAAAVAGLGIVSTSWLGYRSEVESGALVQLLPAWSLGSVPVSAVLPGRQHAKASARAFVEHLVRAFSS